MTSGVTALDSRMVRQPVIEQPEIRIPPVPTSLQEAGLDVEFVRDMIVKIIFNQPRINGQQIADIMCLPYPLLEPQIQSLRTDQLIEVIGADSGLMRSYRYTLAPKGMARYHQAMQTTQYVGPAPVTLESYREQLKSQALSNIKITEEMLKDATKHLVLGPNVLDEVGPAMAHGRSLFMFGAPGNGKTVLCDAIATALPGIVFVPYAVMVDRNPINIYDVTVHKPKPIPGDQPYDARYVPCYRPLVVVGGELRLAMLDLIYEEVSKTYEAPYQMKANGGIFMIDDFGRQQVSPKDILNRWIVPLEKRVDYLNTRTGKKLELPFDVMLIVSTNLDPSQLVDEAFLRRISHKVEIPDPSPPQFATILQRVCQQKGVPYSNDGMNYLFYTYYYDRQANTWRRPMRSVHPRDLVSHIIAIANYKRRKPELIPQLIDQACQNIFAATPGQTLASGT